MRATFFWSALSTMLSVSRWRLRLVVFEVRMWRLNACPRLNLPVPVFLKRLAAPLCVLSFGIAVFPVYNKIAARGQPTHLPTRATLHYARGFCLPSLDFGFRLPGAFAFARGTGFLRVTPSAFSSVSCSIAFSAGVITLVNFSGRSATTLCSLAIHCNDGAAG